MNSKDSHLGKEVHRRLTQLLGPELVDRLERRTAQEAADRIAATVDRMILDERPQEEILEGMSPLGHRSPTPGSHVDPPWWDGTEIPMMQGDDGRWYAR